MKKDQTMVKERLLLLFIFIVKKLYRSNFPLYFGRGDRTGCEGCAAAHPLFSSFPWEDQFPKNLEEHY